jgi:hypothetical protein
VSQDRDGAIDAAQAMDLIKATLADRDSQITELQQAVLELATAAERRDREEAASPDRELIASLEARLADAERHVARMEARLDEQERMLRHTLTMLIEWIEGGEGQRRAA